MLTRLSINGFKNLRDVDLRFGLLTCIAGSNGVGKSNLFDAICFLSDLASMQIVQAALRVRGSNGQLGDLKSLFSFDKSGKPLPMEFVVEAIVPKEVEDDFDRAGTPTATYLKYSLTLHLAEDEKSGSVKDPIYIQFEELRAKRKKEAIGELGFTQSPGFIKQFVVDPKKRTTPFIQTIDDAGNAVIKLFGEYGMHGQPPKIPARKSPQTVLAGVNAISHPTALALRREMQSWNLLQLEPTGLRKPDEFGSKSTVTANGEHLAAALHRTGLHADVAASLSELIPGIDSVEVDNNDVRNLRTLCVTMNGHRFTASALSDGTLRFLALAIMASDPDAFGTICMEEPENGIHPLRIPQIVQLVRQLSDSDTADSEWESLTRLRQVIINTHSPLVVAELDNDELLMADAYHAGQVQLVRFKPIFETWRGPGMEIKNCVSRGQVLNYLDGAPTHRGTKSVKHWAKQDPLPVPTQQILL
jgi:predicted ATPase